MRASRGISIHTGMAFLRNEFYNMSIYRVSFWINLFYNIPYDVQCRLCVARVVCHKPQR